MVLRFQVMLLTRPLPRSVVAVTLLLAGAASAHLTACTSDEGNAADAGLGDSAAGDGGEGLTANDTTALAAGGEAVNVTQVTLSLADTLFDFDPTVDPNATALANAAAVGDHARGNGAGCTEVTVEGATVTVGFGEVCQLANGVIASGSVTIAVAKADATTTLTVTFTDTVVDNHELGGTVTFTTTNGTTFHVVSDSLVSEGKPYAIDMTVTGSAGAMTVSGLVGFGVGVEFTSVNFSQVAYTKGDCYPSGGLFSVKKGPTEMLVYFSAETASTGKVTVKKGPVTTTAFLPGYGACPGEPRQRRDAGLGDRRDGGRRDGGGDGGGGGRADGGGDAGPDAEPDGNPGS